MDTSVHDLNCQLIDRRLEEGLALLRRHYTVTKRNIAPELAAFNIGDRPYESACYTIEGLGNLLVMLCKDVEQAQLSTFVVTPYAKNLPLFSTDFVYTGDQRYFLIELYDLVACKDDLYNGYIEKFAQMAEGFSDMADMPVQKCWYDGIRPVCVGKAPRKDQDELALARFLEALELLVEMEKATPAFTDADELRAKWQKCKDYSDGLVNDGGVSTDMFLQAIGPENTRRFFDEVFFAPAAFRVE